MFRKRHSAWSVLSGVPVVAVALLLVGSCQGIRAADKPANPKWSATAAERYLDGREEWWQKWDRAQKDHGTLCVSCHTQATYGLVRPLLRERLGERELSAQEQTMLASVERRVRGWKEMKPFYSDAVYGEGKEVESRNAESVLNAVILASYDVGRTELSERTRIAFDNAWALQSKTGPDAGSWVWQNFDYAPWESKESQYHWAAMMAVTVGRAPGRYRDDPKIAENLRLLTGYLRSHYETQPLVNRVVALWASAALPSLLSQSQKDTLVNDLYKCKQKGGGWSLTDLGTWKRRDNTPLESRPDGYATGLVTIALRETIGDFSSLGFVHADWDLQSGILWLETHQDKNTGAWPAWSVNKNRDVATPVGQFMSDAATSYAVMALEDKDK